MGSIERKREIKEAGRRISGSRRRREIKLAAEPLERRVMLRSSPIVHATRMDAIIEAIDARQRPFAAINPPRMRFGGVPISPLRSRLAGFPASRAGGRADSPGANQVPGDPGSSTQATFTLVARNASYRNEVGLFLVDDASGRIGNLKPGDRGYSTAALGRAQILFRRDQDAGAVTQRELSAGAYFGTYLVQNGSSEAFLSRQGQQRARFRGRAPLVFFSFQRANADRTIHIVQPRADILRMEDLWRGGDRDYDDAIIQMTFQVQDPVSPPDSGGRPPQPGGGPRPGEGDADPRPGGGDTDPRPGGGDTDPPPPPPPPPPPCGFDSFAGWAIDAGGGGGSAELVDRRIVLREGTSFQVQASRSFVVPAAPTTLDFRFEGLNFDPRDSSFINDAFEVALLGENGVSLVPTFKAGRDAFFNVTEGLSPALGSGAAQTGGTVALDVSTLIPGTTATLVFRLVNNDDDTLSSVAIACLDLDWTPAPIAAPLLAPRSSGSPSPVRATPAATPRDPSASDAPTGRSLFAAASPVGGGLIGADGAIILSTTADFLAGRFTNTVATDEAGGIRLAPDSQRPIGSWSRVVDGEAAGANWGGVAVEADTPPGSTVQTRVRAADDSAALSTTPWTPVATDGRLPGVVGRFLEIETSLRSIADEGTADVIFVVDESGSMAGEQQWIGSMIATLESQLEEYGFQDNRYGLVGFADTPRSLPTASSRFMSAEEFATAARSLSTSRSGTEDGYGGIAHALRDYGFRDDAVGVIVLVTDEDRDIADRSLTRDGILGELADSGVIFHAVLDANLADGDNRAALGVDSSGLAFLQGAAGEYVAGSGGVHVRSGGASRIDYVDLAWELGGTVWDLNRLRAGGDAAAAFTTAFADGLPLEAGNTPVVKSIVAQAVLPPTVQILAPEDRSNLPAGSGFVLSGLATAQQAAMPSGALVRNAIALVTVNGKPVDALDGAGRFFHQADLLPGDNVFEVVAEDAYGQRTATRLTIEGTQAAGVDFSMLSDVSASFDVDYARTSFRRGEATLYADVAVKNIGQYAVATPLYVAIANLSDPTVIPLDADGHAPDGSPYYDVSALIAGGRLNAGQTADPFTFSFWNPRGEQFDYELRFFGLLNRAPAVTTVPRIEALAGKTYQYDVDATDPDGDPVSFRLTTAPAGMAIDLSSGLITWSPTETDLGTHPIIVRVDDGRGGWTEQAFAIETIIPPPNRPPVFTTLPVAESHIGVPYAYAAAAFDPDFDPLNFLIVSGPAGLTVNPSTGLVSWTPRADQIGDAPVVLRVRDGRGGEADQAFSLCVSQTPGNQAPVIVSQPVTSFVLGDAITIQATIRDFNDTHPDFERYSGFATGLVASILGADRTPVFVGLDGQFITSAETFAQWFHDVPGVNLTTSSPLIFKETSPGSGIISYSSSSFFPIDGQLFGDQGRGHNFHFTMEIHTAFTYRGGEVFNFTGDDDVWVYINNSLVVDLGGVHAARSARVDIDSLGLVTGQTYSFDLFFAERHTNASSFTMQTGLQLVTNEAHTQQVAAIDPDGDELFHSLLESPDGMTIDPSTGVIAWSPAIGQIGSHRVSVRVSDGRGGFADQSFDLDVLRQGGDIRGSVGRGEGTNAVGIAGRVVFLDQNGNGRRDADEAATITDSDGQFGFFNLTPGSYIVAVETVPGVAIVSPPGTSQVVTVVSGSIPAGVMFREVEVNPFGPNLDPIISGAPTTAAVVGQVYRDALSAFDPDGNPLTFDLPTAPAGMTVHPILGVVVWTPTADQVGEHQVVLRVRDDRGGLAIQSFTVTVGAGNTAPVVSSTPPGPATAGLPYRYAIAAQDAEGDALAFAFDGPAPEGMSLSADGVLEWPSAGAAGDYPVAILVTDARGAQTRHAFALKVAPEGAPNNAPTATIDARTTAHAGQPYAALVRAVDPDGDPLSLELINKPDGMAIDAAGLISWAPTADQVGGFDVEVKISDGRGGDVVRSFHVDVVTQGVNGAPRVVSVPRLAATVGASYATTLQGSDPDGDPISFRLVSGPRGMSIDSATGSIRWIPSFDQVGPQEVVVEAMDPFLASSSQRFVVVVHCANQGPAITSRPQTEAWRGDPYVYAVRADDPEDDALTFALLAGPTGMTIDSAGVVRWTPGTDQAGRSFMVAIQASDEAGNLAAQSYSVTVAAEARNRPPVFTSRPGAVVVVGENYAYAAQAFDPDGDPLRFEPGAMFPAGMTINPDTGAVSWSTTAGDLGSHIVTIVAIDSGGARASQSFLLDVQENRAPELRPAADPGYATAGGGFRYDVRATDPNGDPLTFKLREGPVGMTVDNNGRLLWTVPNDAVGSHPVVVVVSDPSGAEVVRSFVLEVRPDVDAPQVVVTATPDAVNPGARVTFQVLATDNVRVESLSLTIGGKPLVTGPNGTASLVMEELGLINVLASATDPSGNVGFASTTVRVIDPSATNPTNSPRPGDIDPNDRRAPTVIITSPNFEANVSDKTPIIGTVDDPEDRLWYYRVLYARVDTVSLVNIDVNDPDWILLREGTEEVHNGELAVFDPRNLTRDPHAIIVAAFDLNGQGYISGVTVNVEGGLLLGNYHFEATDLQVPLAGIPITVTRVYDTHNAAREGDFGYGWSLGVQDARILETIPTGQEYVAGKTKVYLTAPDGRRIGFTYQEKLSAPSYFGMIAEPYFTPDPGVYETLEVTTKQIGRGGTAGALGKAFNGPFNPDVFILTTKDGMKYTYDQTAGLKRIDDLNGNFVTFTSQGVQHSSGARIEFARDHRGRITAITQYDREGAQAGEPIRYQYDAVGDLRAVTDQGGLTTRYEYRTTPKHYLDHAIDARGVTVLRVEYEPIPDTPGALRFVALKDALGNTIGQNDYSGLDANTAIIRDANGNERKLVYDARGNVLRETDPLGNITIREYNDPRNPDLETRVIDARGMITDREYDARGNVTKMIERGSASAPLTAAVVTTFAHDDRNNIRTITNAQNQTTSFTYDARNNVLAIVNPLGDVSLFTYDDLGRKKTSTDFNGNTSFFEYSADDCGCVNPRKITHADGTYQTYKYNQFGQATEEAYYEADGTLVEIMTTRYDAQGRVIEEVRGLGADRIVTRKVYDKNLLDYEIIVNPASPNETPATPIAARKSRITDYDYDANGRMIRQTNPDGGVIDFRYDAEGNRILLRDPVGNVTTWVYDANNRVAEERDPFYWADRGLTNLEAIVAANRLPSGVDLAANRGAEHVTAYGYDAAGGQNEIIDRNGRRIEFSYDHAGRKTEERWYAAETDALVRTATWTYDALGNLLEAGDPDSHYTYTYDTLDRVRTIDNAGTPGAPRVVLTHTYDKQGNVVSTSDDSGVTVASEYDARNRLSVRKWFGGDVEPIRIDFQYNAASRQSLLKRFSGLDQSTPVGKTVTTRLSNGQVDKLTHLDAVDAVLAGYDYDYDFGGLVIGEARTHQDPQYNQTITYAYDLNGQLVDADYDTQPDEHFEYDLNGNRIRSANGVETNAYTTGTGNRAENNSTTIYDYDKAGNLIRRTETVVGTVATYEYDHHNRLIRVEERSTEGIILSESRYAYDISGRRIAVLTNGMTTRSVYNGENAWLDADSASRIVGRYVFGDAPDEALGRLNQDNRYAFYLPDRVRSTRDIIDLHGRLTGHAEYGSFGNPILLEGDLAFDRYLFTGREREALNNMYYFRARYFDAALGRFINIDPIGFGSGDVNHYAYARNSPSNATDPSGMFVGFILPLARLTVFIGGALLLTGGIVHGLTGYIAGVQQWTDPNTGIKGLMPGVQHGPQDAFRHALTTCILARQLPDAVVRKLGEAWESGMDAPRSKRMDLANNEIGIGLSKKRGSCVYLAVSAAESRQLTWLERKAWWPRV